MVIGTAGQLGRALVAALKPAYDVIEAVRTSPLPGQVLVDLEDPAGAAATVRSLRPSWIVIAGAYCNVDGAEAERGRCLRVNVEGPRAVAAAAHELGAGVVYYSTDQVFDGTRESYQEGDPVHPLNLYAQSKAQGEAAIRSEAPDRHLILRTAWLYGPDPARRNFALRLVDQLSAGHPVRVPSDQWGTPTYTEDLAEVTRMLLARNQQGTVHAVGPEFLDRMALARFICRCFGLNEARLIPTPTVELGQAARRPLKVRLRCERLAPTGAPSFRGVDAGLHALLRWSEMSATVGRVPAGKGRSG